MMTENTEGKSDVFGLQSVEGIIEDQKQGTTHEAGFQKVYSGSWKKEWIGVRKSWRRAQLGHYYNS